jgi:AcrR family transcriptional regulator
MPREQREREVLTVAAREFGRAGFAAASLARVAEQSGISKAMVLSYFRSKEELFAACVEEAGRNLAEHIEPVLARSEPAAVMAQGTLSAIFTALRERPHDWNLLVDRSVPEGPARDAARAARGRIAEQAGRGVGLATGLSAPLEGAEDLELLTRIWMHAVGATVGWWIDHPERSVEEMTARTGRVIGAVLGVPPQS